MSFAVQRSASVFEPAFIAEHPSGWNKWTSVVAEVRWFKTVAAAELARDATPWPSFVVTREAAEAQLICKALTDSS